MEGGHFSNLAIKVLSLNLQVVQDTVWVSHLKLRVVPLLILSFLLNAQKICTFRAHSSLIINVTIENC